MFLPSPCRFLPSIRKHAGSLNGYDKLLVGMDHWCPHPWHIPSLCPLFQGKASDPAQPGQDKAVTADESFNEYLKELENGDPLLDPIEPNNFFFPSVFPLLFPFFCEKLRNNVGNSGFKVIHKYVLSNVNVYPNIKESIIGAYTTNCIVPDNGGSLLTQADFILPEWFVLWFCLLSTHLPSFTDSRYDILPHNMFCLECNTTAKTSKKQFALECTSFQEQQFRTLKFLFFVALWAGFICVSFCFMKCCYENCFMKMIYKWLHNIVDI